MERIRIEFDTTHKRNTILFALEKFKGEWDMVHTRRDKTGTVRCYASAEVLSKVLKFVEKGGE